MASQLSCDQCRTCVYEAAAGVQPWARYELHRGIGPVGAFHFCSAECLVDWLIDQGCAYTRVHAAPTVITKEFIGG